MSEFIARQLQNYEQLERAPAGVLHAHHMHLVERLARYVRDSVPPMAPRMDRLFDGDEFRFERWTTLPALTRHELVDLTPAMMALAPPEEMGGCSETATSGSTGIPVTVRWTALAARMAHSLRERVYRWHRLDADSDMAFLPFGVADADWPDGQTGGQWTAGGTGLRHVLSAVTPTERQVEWLERKRPRYLTTFATNLDHVARAAIGRGIAIETVLSTGTVLRPQTRALVREAFGANTVDLYGSQEVGLIAAECPASDLLHVLAENLIVEIVDEKNRPVAPGGEGRVLVTSLFNYATPLLRYNLGDVAEVAAHACPCGRTLPGLSRLIGRERRPFVLSDGSLAYTHLVLAAVGDSDLLPARQLQIAQTAPDCFELRYVPRDAVSRPDEAAIRARFRELVHPAAEVRFVVMDVFPPGPGGKYEDFVYLPQ